jgi:hypothetical protein
MWEIRNASKILFEKPERKRQLGRPRCKQEDNIKINDWEKIPQCVDWIHLAQDRNE